MITKLVKIRSDLRQLINIERDSSSILLVIPLKNRTNVSDTSGHQKKFLPVQSLACLVILGGEFVHADRGEVGEAGAVERAIDLVRFYASGAIGVRIGECLPHLGNEFVHRAVFVEVDRAIAVLIEDLNQFLGDHEANRDAAKCNLLQFVGVDGAAAISVDALKPVAQLLHLVLLELLGVTTVPSIVVGLLRLVLRLRLSSVLLLNRLLCLVLRLHHVRLRLVGGLHNWLGLVLRLHHGLLRHAVADFGWKLRRWTRRDLSIWARNRRFRHSRMV